MYKLKADPYSKTSKVFLQIYDKIFNCVETTNSQAHHCLFMYSRLTPLSRQLKTPAKRKWCSSAWPTRVGWTVSLTPSLSCSLSAPKREPRQEKDFRERSKRRNERKRNESHCIVPRPYYV